GGGGVMLFLNTIGNVEQCPLLLADNRNATLVCNYTYKKKGEQEFSASLHKGADSAVEVCSVVWNSTYHNFKASPDFNCLVAYGDKEVNFTLWNMHVNQTDIYFCKIEARYPPPYFHSGESNGTVLHVKEPQSQSEAGTFMVMAAAVGVIAFYSMLITAAFIYCWLKNKKNRILQKDYINMLPRHPPAPRNKNYHPYAPTRNYTAYRSWEP
uniref:CD28 molecule n=1 Tax=Sphenodon punctatus TaxID=8508 RepID=A0A8D0HDT2_SPHPU